MLSLKMARPKKLKKISCEIKCEGFVPIVPLVLDTLHLERDEFEALRLKDVLGMEQKRAAKFMAISQSTFHRVLLKARKKVSDAIVNAKELKINC